MSAIVNALGHKNVFRTGSLDRATRARIAERVGQKYRTGQQMMSYGQVAQRPTGCGPQPGCPPTDPNAYIGYETDRCEEKVLSGIAQAVALSASTTITMTAKTRFCPKRLVIITSGTAGFLVTAFSINNDPQFILGNSVHTAVFAPDAVGVGLCSGCMLPGSEAELSVTNLDGDAAQDIFVHLIGTSN